VSSYHETAATDVAILEQKYRVQLPTCFDCGCEHLESSLFAAALGASVWIDREERLELYEYFARCDLDLPVMSADPLDDFLGTQSRQILRDLGVYHVGDDDGQPGHGETIERVRGG